jgi:hypothetical protein
MSKPSRQQIVASLRNGDRHVFDDADELNDTGAFNGEAVHRGRNGSVVVSFNYDGAYENTTAGGVYDLDLLEEDDGR